MTNDRRVTRRILALLFSVLPLCEGSSSLTRRIVREGIAVEFSIEHDEPGKPQPARFMEGDRVHFRFSVSDTTTGSPITRANPAAWMDRRPDGKARDAAACADRIRELLGGSIFSRAELDLNVYYVLAMNQDATITVVDPLFGFGSTKLLAMVALKSRGEDWALRSDQTRLFVAMPASGQIAVVDTGSWTVAANLDAGPNVGRLALQPDQHYLWSAYDDGVAAVDADRLTIAARIPTGKGPHDIALDSDNRFAFVSNRGDGAVSIIDIRSLRIVKSLPAGRGPASVTYSSLSRMAYVSSEEDGVVSVIDPARLEIVTRIQAEPGLGQIRFAPGGRLGFVLNSRKNVVHIFDSATHRILHTTKVGPGPEQIAFSDKLVYVGHRRSESVLMFPLASIADEKGPSVTEFPGGQNPFGQGAGMSAAGGMVPAPGGNAMLVANPADRAIYYYQEGMAAPMGSFTNYSREPRAVLVLDRSLRDRAPGIYETTATLRAPGVYDVPFFLETPRLVHCFEVAVEPNPALESKRKKGLVRIEPLQEKQQARVGRPVRVRFRLVDAGTRELKTGLTDLRALTFLVPGTWQQRLPVQAEGAGVFAVEFEPPREGTYRIHIESPSAGLKLNSPQFLTLEVSGSDQ